MVGRFLKEWKHLSCDLTALDAALENGGAASGKTLGGGQMRKAQRKKLC